MAKHTHDRSFFATPNPESCYWAGFIAADGCVYPPNGSIRIGLSRKDHNHIEKFKSVVVSTSPVRKIITSNGYEASQIDIYGAYELQASLASTFSVTQSKSQTLKPPKLNDEDDVRHFIRGYMDGDGSISFNGSGRNNHWKVSFLGTLKMLEWIKYNIQFYVNNTGNPSVSPCRNIYQLIFGCYQVKKILNWLYVDSTPNTRLDRKYQKYREVLEFYKGPKRTYASCFKGVSFNKRVSKWTAELKYQGQRYYLGYFTKERDAALAYDAKIDELGLSRRKNL